MIIAGVVLVAITAPEDRSAEPARLGGFGLAAQAFQRNAPNATEVCCDTLTLTLGPGDAITDDEAAAFVQLLAALGFSDATLDRMLTTRPIDGTQAAETDHASMWWSYDPDRGLTAILEPAG